MGAETRVGIICLGQFGDVAESTGVFKYREQLWGKDPEIHWFVARKHTKPLLENPHIIIHECTSEDSKLATKYAFGMAKDLGLGKLYTPAPYMNWNLVWKIPLPRIPPFIFGLQDWKTCEWRPQIWLTEDEIAGARDFMRDIPGKYKVMLETAAFSQQGGWTDEMLLDLARRSKRVTFLAASFGEADRMKKLGISNVVGLDSLGFRQLTEVYNFCQAFIGVPSGAASITCAERCHIVPRFEIIEKSRCPPPGMVGPDWGTHSMLRNFHTSDPKILLDKYEEMLHNGFRRDRKTRRRDERRMRRLKATISPGAGASVSSSPVGHRASTPGSQG